MSIKNLPETIRVPGGKFKIGSPQGEGCVDEHPQVELEVETFEIGKYPVTFDQYDEFCEATGRELPHDAGWGRGSRPVINVNWQDACDYCRWLSQQTGYMYRLPTEAEWEYACRAGSTTAYPFGSDPDKLKEYAVFNVNRTEPVGTKLPNNWGIYDMLGNVWEWTLDTFTKNYETLLDKHGKSKNV